MMQGLDRSSIEGYRKYSDFEKKYLLAEFDSGNREIFHAVHIQQLLFYDIDTTGKKTLMVRIKNFWRGKGGGTLAMGGSLDDIRQSIILGGNRECKISGVKLSDEEQDIFKRLGNWEKLNDTSN